MLEATKEHHIEARFTGAPEKIQKLTRFAKTIGLDEPSSSLPWRALFTEFEDEPSYGVALRGTRGKENLTQKELAGKTGIPQSHISLMEHGKMTIGKERAKRLAKALRVNHKIFL